MIANLPDGNSPLEDYEIFADVDFIITDLDGTLIDGEKPVLGQIKKSISKLKRKQTQISVATGRTYYGAESRMKEIGISVGMPVALYNGGVVIEYGTGNILYASYIPNKLVQDLIEILNLKKTNMYVYTFSASFPFVFGVEQNFVKEEVFAWGELQNRQDVNGMSVQHMQGRTFEKKEISAILIENAYLSRFEIERINKALHQYSGIKITDSGNGFLEIKGDGMNKGILYNILKRNEKLSIKKILAIGDNDNDIELFSGADISVAVANSSHLAIDYADYICNNKSAQGFYDMLYVLEIAKRYY